MKIARTKMQRGIRGRFPEIPVMSRPARRRPFLSCTMLAAAALGACSGDFNPVRDVAVKTGLGAERKDGPDFVRQSRPADLDYAPVGVAAPKPKIAAKGAGDVKAVEGQMDAIRAANEARANEARQAGAAVAASPVAPAAR
jgi:hypothetical protein